MTYTRTEWLRASRRRPCPVCQRPDWCLIASDGSAAICPRTPSEKWVGKNGGGGYLHKLNGAVLPIPPPREARPAPKPKAEMVNLMRQYRSAVNAERLERLSEVLGVSVASLERLGIGWAFDKNAWAFPLTNADGGLLGIRLRCDNGRKFSVTGGHEGLHIPDGLADGGMILFCEGPTDCAALLDLGFCAVGRPSCMGSVELVRGVLNRGARRDVVILADNDAPKTRPDGSTWRPGPEGAARLAQDVLSVARSVKVVMPPFCKDAREWKAAGATKAVVDAVIRAARYVRKDGGR